MRHSTDSKSFCSPQRRTNFSSYQYGNRIPSKNGRATSVISKNNRPVPNLIASLAQFMAVPSRWIQILSFSNILITFLKLFGNFTFLPPLKANITKHRLIFGHQNSRRTYKPFNPNRKREQKKVMSQALNRDYQISDEIGRGRFGTVFKCTSRSTGDSFAVKSINKSLSSGDSIDAQCLLTEPKILHLLSPHPHVIQLYNIYEDESYLHMVVELCSGQDLHDLIIANGAVSESEARVLFTQLMEAVSHCHNYGVVHRDIKPDNILLDSRNSVKLADFGSAEVIMDGGTINGVVGTPYYVAPEILAGRDYGEKVDVWSAGVVLYVMLAGFPPFYGETAVEIFDVVMRGNLRFPSRAFHAVSPAVKDLLRRMLCKDVSKRFSAQQVLRHPWIANAGG